MKITFKTAILIAIIVHIAGLTIYATKYYNKKTPSIKYTTIKVKIGNDDIINSKKSKATTKPIQKPKKLRKNYPTNLRKAPKTQSTTTNNQINNVKTGENEQWLFVFSEEDYNSDNKVTGTKLGNVTLAQQKIINSYVELLSLWFKKHEEYPKAAKEKGLIGDAIIRITIDRSGTIVFYEIEKTTGHFILDQSIKDMIERANPVPAIPDDYPSGNKANFRIPIQIIPLRE